MMLKALRPTASRPKLWPQFGLGLVTIGLVFGIKGLASASKFSVKIVELIDFSYLGKK